MPLPNLSSIFTMTRDHKMSSWNASALSNSERSKHQWPNGHINRGGRWWTDRIHQLYTGKTLIHQARPVEKSFALKPHLFSCSFKPDHFSLHINKRNKLMMRSMQKATTVQSNPSGLLLIQQSSSLIYHQKVVRLLGGVKDMAFEVAW